MECFLFVLCELSATCRQYSVTHCATNQSHTLHKSNMTHTNNCTFNFHDTPRTGREELMLCHRDDDVQLVGMASSRIQVSDKRHDSDKKTKCVCDNDKSRQKSYCETEIISQTSQKQNKKDGSCKYSLNIQRLSSAAKLQL